MRKILFLTLFGCSLALAQTRYVNVTALGSQDGTSEANAWSMSQALANDASGMVLYVKAGNYGSGSVSGFANGSEWIGYTSTPGDVSASNGSTFSYGQSVSASVMPLWDGSNTGTCFTVSGDGVTLRNFQIKDYSTGMTISGSNHVLDNIISIDMGNQVSGGYDGFGIACYSCTNVELKNSYVENSTAEAVKIYGGSGNFIRWTEVRADNSTNPCDYYILVTNTSGNIVEDSHVQRAGGLSHGGHGLCCKWNSQNNIFRRCSTVYTNIELNFEDVTGNLYEDITLTGQGTGAGFWHTNIDLRSGANGNTLRNIYMTNVWSAVNFSDDDDGFAPNPDTDGARGGYNNRIENLVVENADRIFQFVEYEWGGYDQNGLVSDNVFDGCTFINYGSLGSIYVPNSGNQFINCAFKDGTNGISLSNGYSNNVNFTTNNYDNVSHSAFGTGATTHPSGFTNTGGGALDFELGVGSLLIGAGTDTTNPDDYNGVSRGTTHSIGAFQGSGGGPSPTCNDGIQNQGETAVDCGGPNCDPCEDPDMKQKNSIFGTIN